MVFFFFYRCLMKNTDFDETAPMFTKRLIDRRTEINSTVRLSCQVIGLPTPIVLWYKDGRPLDLTGTKRFRIRKITKTGRIEIGHVDSLYKWGGRKENVAKPFFISLLNKHRFSSSYSHIGHEKSDPGFT